MKPLFIAIALFVSFSTAVAETEVFNKIYENQAEADRLRYNSRSLEFSEIKKLEQQNQELILGLTNTNPEFFNVAEPKSWTVADGAIAKFREDKLLIHDLEAFRFSDSEPKAFYLMESNRSKDYRLSFVNTVKDKKDRRLPLRAQLSCDGPYLFKVGLTEFHKKSGEIVDFDFVGRDWVLDNYYLHPSRELNSCTLTFDSKKNPYSSNHYGIRILKENKFAQGFADLRNSYEICSLPRASQVSGAKAFFLSGKYRQLTCPDEVPLVEALEDGEEGFIKRMEALTGSKLTLEDLKKQDPYLPLDFSKAPKLDLIIVSYLVFKSDTTGHLTSQALKWHADRGTQVRILAADVLQEVKDKKMLYDLTASNGNIKLIEYKYFVQAKRGSFLDPLHRTNHVKILLTYSKENEKANMVFIGGRNLHDGFMYRQAPIYKKYPELVDYQNKDEEFFSFWRDFEIKVVSKSFTQHVASHFFTLWDEEGTSQFVRSYNLNLSSENPVSDKYFENEYLVRNLISVPFKENQQLEVFFSDMIDSAKKKILLSTPYFRPTKMIQESFHRAIERGVEITLITRLDLKGDMVDWILSDVNKDGVNQFLGKIKVFEYTEKDVILHSKLVMIDSEMTLVGGINLNKRSFVHDTENGVLVYSPKFAQHMEKVMELYMEKSSPIDKEIDVSFIKRIIIFVFDDKF